MNQIRSDLHHQQQHVIMHFKKKWLQQERTMSFHRDQPTLNSDPRETPAISCPSPSASSPRQPHSGHLEAHITDQMFSAPGLRHHPQQPTFALNIPRFAKYGMASHTIAPTQFSVESSAVSTSLAAAADLPWLLPQSPESFKLHLDMDKPSIPAVKSQERLMMIDINKPPPSPSHSMDSEVEPSTPCSGSVHKPLRSSPGYALAAGEHSNRASPAQRALLARSDSTKVAHFPSRKRGHAAAGSVARVVPGPSERPHRSTDFSLGGVHSKGSPNSSRRKPRTTTISNHHQQALHTSAQLRYPLPMALEPLSQKEAESSHEEGDEEGEEESSEVGEREGRGSGDEYCFSKEGTPKACLHCGTTKTPLWRNGPPGPKSLCNACGIRFNKIRSGKRKPTAKEASMLMKYERSNSLSSNASDVTSCHQEKTSAAAQQQQQRHQVPLPVPTVHKSRSKLGHRSSAGHDWAAAEAKEEEEEAAQDLASSDDDGEIEARPLRAMFGPKAKKLCVSPSGSNDGMPSPAKMWRPSPPPAPAAERREQFSFHEFDRSSDGESCVSEPACSPPGSPGEHTAECTGEEQLGWGIGGKSKGEDEGSDVEAGARLLMAILHSAPAMEC